MALDISYGFVSGFATLGDCEYDLYTLYRRIPVCKTVVQKKICINGFKNTVHKVPGEGFEFGSFDREKVSFLEIKTKNNVVIGIYNSKKVKITGNITEKFSPEDCERYCRWFVDRVCKLKYTGFQFLINNITASFRVGYGIQFRQIAEIFSTSFREIQLADQETPPYNITRMYVSHCKEPLLVALSHVTGYFQVMGAKNRGDVVRMRDLVQECLVLANPTKMPLTVKQKSKFASVGMQKKRGRPSKAELQALELLQRESTTVEASA